MQFRHSWPNHFRLPRPVVLCCASALLVGATAIIAPIVGFVPSAAGQSGSPIDDPGRGLVVSQPLQLTPAEPVAGELVRATFTLHNDSTQAIVLKDVVAAVRGPDCTVWDCPQGGDFPSQADVTIAPGGSFSYDQARAFADVGTGYFAGPAWLDDHDVWRIGLPGQDRVDFSVGAGIEIGTQLALDPPNSLIDQQVTATYVIHNASSRDISLAHVGVVTRGPDCATPDWTCAGIIDFSPTGEVTIPAGGTTSYQAGQAFPGAGAYFAEAAFADPNGWWHPIPGEQRVDFTVSRTEPAVAVTPPSRDYGDVMVGSTSAQTFTVTDVGTADLHLGSLGVLGANPDQFPAISDSCSSQTLAPDASCAIVVTFEPTSQGARSATLSVPSDATTSPDSAPLTGNGTVPPVRKTVLIDDLDTGFTHGGPRWHGASGGHAGHFYWAPTGGGGGSTTATWSAPTLQGKYEAYAWVPGTNATTRKARYGISGAGPVASVLVDQNADHGRWVLLGTYVFAQGGSITVTAGTGENARQLRRLAADAIRFVPVP